MRPQVVTVTGVADSAAIPLDIIRNPFQVGFGVIITGTATYTVQHTFDNVMAGVTPRWFDHPDVAAKTVNDDGNYAYPIRALRLHVTASSGSVEITIIQAGHRGA